MSVWAGTGKVIYLAWDLGSCSYITLHFCAKAVEKKKMTEIKSMQYYFDSLEVCLAQNQETQLKECGNKITFAFIVSIILSCCIFAVA